MLISYKWLKKYLPGIDSISKETIAEALTTKLAEVECIKPVRTELKKIYAAEVISIEPVTGSKKLSFCQVALSTDVIKKVICGAPNVTKGAKVALVLAGGVVYDAHSNTPGATFQIESREVMGILSDGMLCSQRELGLSNEHEGIIILEPEMPLGTDLTEILADYVFEIENKGISHRPDCFSHKGIAREIAAFFDIEFVETKIETSLVATKKLDLEIQQKAPAENCPRFATICLADVNVHASPLWLQAMLSATGIRPINNIVDASNYVMFDKGQPLHTYDYDKLATGKIGVRMAKPGEEIVALDGKKYKLEPNMIAITNGSKVSGIAGLMGGEESEITNATKNVVIEAANFNMYSIRKASRNLGLRTEASTRFEKGLDPELAMEGLIDSVQIIEDLSQGEIASEINDVYLAPRTQSEVRFDLALVPRFLGISLSTKEIVSYLERLGLKVADVEKLTNLSISPEINQDVTVIIPTHRGDLKIAVDILEEIARMYGYENFKPTLPDREITAEIPNKGTKLQRQVVATLAETGMDEMQTYSFVSEKLYNKMQLKINECLAIKNPISPEDSHMRNLILPNMLEKIANNAVKYNNFKAFELGRIVTKELDQNNIHLQPVHVAGFSYAKEDVLQFPLVKGILEQLALDLGVTFKYEVLADTHHFVGYTMLHPGRSAVITCNDKYVGFIGELHPAIVTNLDLKGRVGMFELDASALSQLATYHKAYKQPSIYQAIERDLTFWLSNKTSYADVINALDALHPLLTKVTYKDIYTKTEDTEHKALTLTLTLQSQDKTLVEAEITDVINQVIAKLTKDVKADFKE